jgi:hypothetical protein
MSKGIKNGDANIKFQKRKDEKAFLLVFPARAVLVICRNGAGKMIMSLMGKTAVQG